MRRWSQRTHGSVTGVGESQPRQVESWLREGLETNLTVEGCGSP